MGKICYIKSLKSIRQNIKKISNSLNLQCTSIPPTQPRKLSTDIKASTQPICKISNNINFVNSSHVEMVALMSRIEK